MVSAKQQLLQESVTHCNQLETVEPKVFFGLTDGEALQLGSRHNQNGHLTHEMSHRDYVGALSDNQYRCSTSLTCNASCKIHPT